MVAETAGRAAGSTIEDTAGGSPSGRLRLQGADWHALIPGRRPGELPRPGEMISVHGALAGDSTGHFYATSIFVGAPLGGGPQAASYVETHHFNLDDGTLVGTGTWHVDGVSRFAVVGGTGRYAGASGSYEAVQRPLELGGDGTAAFNFNLMLQGGGDGS